jgi:MoaA/NifB/PqqE/SkfB family radical SAM enzyme
MCNSLVGGIDLLNISLDTLDPHKFEIMTRRRGHQRVLDAINQAVELGYNPVKVTLDGPCPSASLSWALLCFKL